MWDWVGGRYSLWSAVGLPIAIRLGPARFAELLAGAASVDEHFRSAPFERNLPVLLGLVGWWNTRFLGHPERVVVPYAHALGLLPSFLQQLVLESNGKRVRRDGDAADAAVLRRAVGHDRHRRAARVLPVAAPGAARSAGRVHRAARAPRTRTAGSRRCSSPTRSRRRRRSSPGATPPRCAAELAGKGLSGPALDAAIAARVCPGNRASTMILLPALDARRLGQLLALYEHRTFVEAVLAGINCFDQFGVELGKTLAGPIIAALTEGTPLPDTADASTRGLVARVRAAAGAR